MTETRISLLVSGCLTGRSIRFDGGHKHNRYLMEVLGRHFELVSVCPEISAGLGVPREPIRLVSLVGDLRVRGTRDAALDVTDRIDRACEICLGHASRVAGAVLKRGSPTCGMERVKIYTLSGMPASIGSGIFARKLRESMPHLPVEEEGRLQDPLLRENFFTRVYVLHRWRTMLDGGVTPSQLVDFHTRHKMVLLAHSQALYRQAGPLVAEAGKAAIDDLAQRYFSLLMQALEHRASRRQHTNVLQHLLGHLRGQVDPGDRAQLRAAVDDYRRGLVPLVVPITLLKHYFRRQPDSYISRQYYLDPYPAELMLRNAI